MPCCCVAAAGVGVPVPVVVVGVEDDAGGVSCCGGGKSGAGSLTVEAAGVVDGDGTADATSVGVIGVMGIFGVVLPLGVPSAPVLTPGDEGYDMKLGDIGIFNPVCTCAVPTPIASSSSLSLSLSPWLFARSSSSESNGSATGTGRAVEEYVGRQHAPTHKYREGDEGSATSVW